jgi:MSHA biogenesis protein MshO
MRQMPPKIGGFTLVEMITTMTLLAIVAGLGAAMVRPVVDSYIDGINRHGLADNADLVARRLERDLHGALANSVRVKSITNGYALEFIPLKGGGLYRSLPTASGLTGKDVLRFDQSDSSFDLIGPVPVYASTQFLVIANLGEGSGSDAYAGTNRSTLTTANTSATLFSTDAAPHTLGFAARQFPVPSPAGRFQIVEAPITYVCDTSARTLTRYTGYGWNASQVVPTTGGSVLTTLISPVSPDASYSAAAPPGCTFRYASNSVTSRAGLVSMELRLTNSRDEHLDIIVQVNVANEP